ncbi:MAG TPA: LLM class F420-dependent oxidoreductase [Povalibacter sp.]|uniref:LLM class F420-dependent oxidoreductase n=1 Tax=Povalibacter sp. TaxID=1962978 RepID=UPI002C6436B2|nr:LLM class F420-dependent oxidoreductase [Povalibacter sp.]HMN47415.1 LLM class F420-dependent oxidoreductase [Povalibacter sp.]
MKVGLQIPNFTWPGGAAAIGPTLANIARTADTAGFRSLWVMDHFFQISYVGPPEMEMLEGYSALTFMAAVTKQIQLGTLVTGVTYRHPGILIKTVTTLDVLSGGRAWFGVGAAWNEQESRGLGTPFPPIAERFEWLEETLQIAKQMWSSDNGPYRGRHFQLEQTLCSPQPLSRPHLPIMIGGGGEKKTLRLVAQYADACNLFGDPPAVKAKLDVLKQHCDRLGRDFGTIETTILNTVHLAPGKMSAKDVIEKCRGFADVGVQHVIFNMPNVHEIAPIETFGREIIPAVAGF